jgi:serine/threonine protein kinase
VHAHKLLHLDLKPSNIYLRSNGSPVLIDFGAARTTLMADTADAQTDVHAGLRFARALRTRDDARPVERHLQRRRQRCTPACPALRHRQPTAARKGQRDSGHGTLGSGSTRRNCSNTIDWCMDLNHLNRPQSVFALQKALVETIRLTAAPKREPKSQLA